MEAEESKHSNIKKEVKVLDDQYQKTKKEFDVSRTTNYWSTGTTFH